MRLGLGEPAQPIEAPPIRRWARASSAAPERSPPLVLDDREGVLIFLDRRVEVSLRLEDPAEVDMHLKLLAIGGFLVELGSRIGERGLIGPRPLRVVVGRGRRCRRSACRGAVTQPAAASAIVAARDQSTIDRTRGGSLLPDRSLSSIDRSTTSCQRTPIEADSVGGSGNAGADIWLRAIVLPKLLTASTPIAPG